MVERLRFHLYIQGIVLSLIALSYVLIISGITMMLGITFVQDNPILLAFTIIILAMVFNPIRRTLQYSLIDKYKWIKPINKQIIDKFIRDLSAEKTTQSITSRIRQFIIEMVNPSQLHIYLVDNISNSYHSALFNDHGIDEKTTEVIFESRSELAKILAQKKKPLILDHSVITNESIKTELPKIALLRTKIFIPIHGRTNLIGWISLGDHPIGIPYKQKELDLLQDLCNQAASVVEQVQISTDLDRRINEMNVLTRVSQGVNITLAFDDMLELIYTQINQIISVSIFHVVLKSQENNELKYVFYVDEDERISDKENTYIQDGFGLDREVISGQQPIVTDDYDKECRTRGVIPYIKNLYAWAGVPLNTGAETMGLISLGSRQPDINFSSAQINLLQSIADQAAGAMVKVQLLQESERRTSQLRYLNKITRNLSEILEPKLLLQHVLDGAVELLNCESGGVFLLDQYSNELTQRECIGLFYNNLNEDLSNLITRIRKNVVTEGKVNVFHYDNTSPHMNDNKNDRLNTSIINGLIVPILLKDKTIGCLEVFNRNDDLAFSKDDQELLNAFASQSAIAYDIAEKYTFTDQSLAARVEELSVMQQIDRELNTSLDVSRAMDITMTWAIRQSKAESGFVGVVEKNTIRVMSAYGFGKTSPPDEIEVGVDTPLLKKVLDTGEPQNGLLSDLENKLGQASIRKGAQAQYVIPIKREDEVIGIIFLETSKFQKLAEETMAFLIRLGDHAAIAIANAQLYLEVQAANLAKSEFVSFVSHELKTPMTSIKGFADLLAAGAVGPINDVQNNFLTTIRSNVDRMATLVSDLTDVSRIEAGRMRLDFEAVAVNDVVEEIVRSSNNQLHSKDQTLMIDIEEQLPAIWGDKTRIIQILTNIVSNAHKYSPDNSQIEIYAELSKNIWDPDGSSPVVHIYVKDNGYGISLQDQRYIFDKFFRADDPNIREVSGTGLGLNITKTLVEMQGGKIWFESKINEGTTFHITVPTTDTR